METTTSDAATKGEELELFIIWRARGYTAERVPNFSVFSGCVSRLQRPNVYLPVHLYGQLVHDKTGCHLLEAQVTSSADFLAVAQPNVSLSTFFAVESSGSCRFRSLSS